MEELVLLMKISWFFPQLRFFIGFRSLCRSMLQIKSLVFHIKLAGDNDGWRCTSAFIVNFEHNLHLVLVFLLLTLNM